MKTYKKQVLRYGKWKHPSAKNGVLNITKGYIKTIANNFKRSPFAPVVRGHNADHALETNPQLIINKNIKGLEIDDKGLNAIMDIEDKELEKYNDVSVSIDPNYTDHETGKFVGPLLKHVAMVVNPYIKGLNPFIAMGEDTNLIINLSEIMTNTKSTDVNLEDTASEETKSKEAEEAKAEETKEAEVTDKTEDKTSEEKPEETKEPEATTEDEESKVETSEKLKARIATLEEKVNLQEKDIAEKEAEAKVIKLSEEGKVIPVTANVVKELYLQSSTEVNLSDGSNKSIGSLLDELFEKMPRAIDFTEKGVNVETGEIDSGILAGIRRMHPKKTDAEFKDYIEKNKAIILEK